MKKIIKALNKHTDKKLEEMMQAIVKQSNEKLDKKDFTIREDILYSSTESLDLGVFPRQTKSNGEQERIFFMVTNNLQTKDFNVFQVSAGVTENGFTSSVVLNDTSGKQLMYLPFQEKCFGSGSVGSGMPVAAKVKSAHAEKQGDSTVLVVGGTTNNRDWEVRMTLDKYNYPIEVDITTKPRSYFT